MKKTSTIIIFFNLLFCAKLLAATVQRNTYIYRYPYKNSEKVDRVYRNQKASIKGSTGAFYKVKIISKRNNRSIEGWIAKQAFVPLKKAAAPVISQKQNKKTPYKPVKKRKNNYPYKKRYSQKPPVLFFSVGPSYSAINYLIRSEDNFPFYSYWTGGPGVDFSLKYKLSKSPQATKQYFFQINSSYHLFKPNANLNDSAGNTFLKQTLNQNMFQIHPSLHYINQSSNTLNWGLNLGYQIQSFNSDDIQNINQASQNVFNSFSSSQLTLGLSMQRKIANRPFGMNIQYAFAGNYKDKSANNILADTQLKLGLIGQVYYDYTFNRKHKVRFNYLLDYKHYTNDNSFDLTNETYSNSAFEYLQHIASVEYQLSF
ncbi:MAG TPA: hypothetical protein PKC21_01445 [Oligoflexia bacterium]|nr:hypothetical protein [Oligoflexia bacterium]HMR23995.1 hypothetical protein [Oligoflexia bacterium]